MCVHARKGREACGDVDETQARPNSSSRASTQNIKNINIINRLDTRLLMMLMFFITCLLMMLMFFITSTSSTGSTLHARLARWRVRTFVWTFVWTFVRTFGVRSNAQTQRRSVTGGRAGQSRGVTCDKGGCDKGGCDKGGCDEGGCDRGGGDKGGCEKGGGILGRV
jgi:hypothetical protein